MELIQEILKIKYLALLVAIVATLYYKKYSFGRARYFLFSLWLIALTELSRKIVYDFYDGEIEIRFISNTYTILQFIFYLLWYRSLLTNKKRINFFLWALVFFICFSVANSIFMQNFYFVNQTYTYSVGVLLVCAVIFSFFVEFLRSERIIKFERSVYFWFSLGILLFHVPFLPFMFTAQIFDFQAFKFYGIVVKALNIIMHLCFLIGILWSQKKYNY